MKKFPKRMFLWMMSALLVLSLSATMAFANENVTSPTYNHGTMAVTADGGGDTISMMPGGTASISISPYIHVQYEGCQMEMGDVACPDMCGGDSCFQKGLGCSCASSPVMRTAKVTVKSDDESIVKASEATAVKDAGSKAGSTADGKIELTATGTGETEVTVSASLCDWVTTEKTFTVKVNDVISISDFDVSSDHKGPNVPELSMGSVGTDTQTAYISLDFAEEMKIVDENALMQELMKTVKIHNQALGGKMGEVKNVSLSADGKTFSFEISGWVAPYSGQITSSGIWQNLTTKDGSKLAESDVTMLMPNGLTTEIIKQVAADEKNNASVTTKIVAPESSTRGMVHLVVLKNGKPIPEGSLTSYGGTYTGHWHDYLKITASEFVEMYSGGIQDTLGENYIVTGNGDEITITAKDSKAGDVLELHVLSYLNNGSKNIDTSVLEKAGTDASAIDKSLYTDESFDKVEAAAYLASVIMQDTTYYSQADVNSAADRIQTNIDALVKKGEEGKDPGQEEQKPGVQEGEKTQDSNKGEDADKDNSAATGDETPIVLMLALMLAGGTAVGAVIRRKAS